MFNLRRHTKCRECIFMIFFFKLFLNLRKGDITSIKFVFADNRQRGRLAGFSLYISTTGDIKDSTLCYKDGPQIPPLNFTTTCTQHGRYVIFYNERLDGVVYPQGYELANVVYEICEVVVQGILDFLSHLFLLAKLPSST